MADGGFLHSIVDAALLLGKALLGVGVVLLVAWVVEGRHEGRRS